MVRPHKVCLPRPRPHCATLVESFSQLHLVKTTIRHVLAWNPNEAVQVQSSFWRLLGRIGPNYGVDVGRWNKKKKKKEQRWRLGLCLGHAPLGFRAGLLHGAQLQVKRFVAKMWIRSDHNILCCFISVQVQLETLPLYDPHDTRVVHIFFKV